MGEANEGFWEEETRNKQREEKKETGCSITSRCSGSEPVLRSRTAVSSRGGVREQRKSSLLIRLNILFFRVRHTLACHGEQPMVSLGLLLNPFLIVRPSMICKSLNGSACSGLRAITAADVTMASVWCTQPGDSFISLLFPGSWSIRSILFGDRDITAYEGAFKDDSLHQ